MWDSRVSRRKNVVFKTILYQLSQRFPNFMKNILLKRAHEDLGPGYDVATHFTPRYNPWQQRMCLVPDGDMFGAIKSNRASIVTDHIDTFTEKGLLLKSGKELEAAIIFTATGLAMQAVGAIDL